LQQGADVTPGLRAIGSIRNLNILSEHDYTLPIIVGPDRIGFYADKRILPHPQNLLPQCRKTVQAIDIKSEIDGYNVRPIIGAASQSAKAQTREDIATFLTPQFRD